MNYNLKEESFLEEAGEKMKNIIRVQSEDGEEIVFELEESSYIGKKGIEKEDYVADFNSYFDPLRSLANQLAKKIGEIDIKPSEVEISVGIKIATEAGIIFTKVGADTDMSVKMIWKNNDTGT